MCVIGQDSVKRFLTMHPFKKPNPTITFSKGFGCFTSNFLYSCNIVFLTHSFVPFFIGEYYMIISCQVKSYASSDKK